MDNHYVMLGCFLCQSMKMVTRDLYNTGTDMPLVKNRQYRSRGGPGFSLILHKPKGVKCVNVYEIKANIFPYPLILHIKWFCVHKTHCKRKGDFFHFYFLCKHSSIHILPLTMNFIII